MGSAGPDGLGGLCFFKFFTRLTEAGSKPPWLMPPLIVAATPKRLQKQPRLMSLPTSVMVSCSSVTRNDNMFSKCKRKIIL